MKEIAGRLGAMPGVIAVALGGSWASGIADSCSDVDLYVYAPEPPPLELRRKLAMEGDPAPELDNQAFGPGDEWTDQVTGVHVDVMYWSPGWISAQIARVLDDHQASAGYSTSFWRTVRESNPLVDHTGWFAELQSKTRRPYPEPLRQAIIALNLPLLRQARSSFLHQIVCAIERGDLLSVNHRAAALLASYFDILFALNRVPHPGEKRQIQIAKAECPHLPPNLEPHINELIAAIPPPWSDGRLQAGAHRLIDDLESLLGEKP